jgi:UDP-N-acetyl-D-mannosaminuronic acid dehydrogenase
MPVFWEAGLTILGHDPMVTDDVIRQYGGEPTSLDKALGDADAVLVMNDHPDYRAVELSTLLGESRPKVVYDSWRILDEHALRAAGIRYASIGYLPASRDSLAGVQGLSTVSA